MLENTPPKKGVNERVTVREEYEGFRQIVLHIKVLQTLRRLYLSPLEFDEEIEGISVSKAPEGKDVIDALEKQYHWHQERKDGSTPYILKKHYTVPALLDFNIDDLEKEAKEKLLNKMFKDLSLSDYMKLGQSVVIVYFRAEKDKNNWPIYGLLRLRNFRQVLQFLAESLQDQSGYEREYDVRPNPKTETLIEKNLNRGEIENPPLTLTVNSGKAIPRDSTVGTNYNGESFWVYSPGNRIIVASQQARWDNLRPARWDAQVFEILYELFRINRTEPTVSPTITAIPTK